MPSSDAGTNAGMDSPVPVSNPAAGNSP
jgi:hypothetical protein